LARPRTTNGLLVATDGKPRTKNERYLTGAIGTPTLGSLLPFAANVMKVWFGLGVKTGTNGVVVGFVPQCERLL
jgi:hypothetical protein